MDSVWLGYDAPVNGLVSDTVIAKSNPTLLSGFEKNIYRVGWHPIPMVWYDNKDVFEKAGHDPQEPPKTLDNLPAACEKIRAIYLAPVGGGAGLLLRAVPPVTGRSCPAFGPPACGRSNTAAVRKPGQARIPSFHRRTAARFDSRPRFCYGKPSPHAGVVRSLGVPSCGRVHII